MNPSPNIDQLRSEGIATPSLDSSVLTEKTEAELEAAMDHWRDFYDPAKLEPFERIPEKRSMFEVSYEPAAYVGVGVGVLFLLRYFYDVLFH